MSHKLSLREVTKDYHGVRVLSVPELDVREGEFFSLLGPSGSGKTTTLKLIAGFEALTTGSIEIDGRDVAPVPVEKRNIGVVFQNYALFPHMTVAQNIAFPLETRRVPRPEIARRVAEVLELVDLAPHRDKNAALLSGGQQQRVAIGRTLVFEPSLLLMDEPLGALDRKLRQRLQEELRALQRKLGITVVYVTHDQDEAMSMSDRIAIMNHGVVEQLGAPRGLYDRPETLFVSNFLGDNNTLRAQRSSASSLRFSDGIEVPAPESAHPAGAALSVTLRPERVALASPVSGPQGASRLRGTVTDAVALGAITSYSVRVDGIGDLKASVQHSGGDYFIGAPGDEVLVGWDVEDLHLFADSGGVLDAGLGDD
ncbi:ABC transporter ATP-binding protein [Microbacterium sp. MYb66]|uniref:ABC transporter ATP-binding protein n=1 Tax=Microbacterium sp. MYb66 TaxID=1848692 RepID=UPI0015E35C40|nr:ABC transporter ATP-binding protein [Microbacterium sp. MYb66]